MSQHARLRFEIDYFLIRERYSNRLLMDFNRQHPCWPISTLMEMEGFERSILTNEEWADRDFIDVARKGKPSPVVTDDDADLENFNALDHLRPQRKSWSKQQQKQKMKKEGRARRSKLEERDRINNPPPPPPTPPQEERRRTREASEKEDADDDDDEVPPFVEEHWQHWIDELFSQM